MIDRRTRLAMIVAAASSACALGAAGSSNAATLPVANGGNLYLSVTTTGSGSSPLGNMSALAIPGTFTYQDSWSAPQSTVVATTTAGFYDDFIFSIGTGQADSITSSISLGSMLGISSMQVRLYDYAANGQVAPLLSAPAPGTVFDAWSSMVSFPGGTNNVDVLPTTTLGAGTYVLEVRGTVTGTSGGSYTGSLNVTPVPLPPGLPLLASGLVLLAVWSSNKAARSDTDRAWAWA